MNLMEHGSDSTEDYVTLLTSHQARIYAYIMSLLGSREQTLDVLQETNLVLWRKAGEFTPGTNFIAWAFRIAHNKVMTHRQRVSRSRLVFDDELLKIMSDEITVSGDDFAQRQAHLSECLKSLPQQQEALIRMRYAEGTAVKTIAERIEKSPNAVTKILHRIQTALMRCIELRQASGAAK